MLAFLGITNSCNGTKSNTKDELSYISDSLPYIIDDYDKGYELGVSAMFAAKVADKLIVAGGCNFPDTPVAEGGKKHFYDGIYALNLNDDTDQKWVKIGHLPKPLAYGAYVQWHDSLVCIGGQNSDGSTSETFIISCKDSISFTSLPSLPCTLDNAYAALWGDVVYVAGGNADGVPSDAMYALDLSDTVKGWKHLTTLPDGARVQPVITALDGTIYLWGGFSNKKDEEAFVQTTGWKYDIAHDSWTEIAVPSSFVGGGCAMTLDDEHILTVGGVNADIFQRAIRGEFPNPEYLMHEKEWYQFNQGIHIYNIKKNTWNCIDEFEQAARAGAGIIPLPDGFVFIQGEEKPGIRTPMITRFKRMRHLSK